jgi:integrase
MMPNSHKGNGYKNTHTGVPIDHDLLEILTPVISNRPKSAILLERWRNKQVPGTIRWERSDRGEWRTSSELNRPWYEIRNEAGLPEVIQYALRHSSIIRWLKAFVPTSLVAALHDTSEAMLRRHYGRHIADSLDDIAAGAVVPLMGRPVQEVV